MAKKDKTAKTPNVDPIPDPADAFARQETPLDSLDSFDASRNDDDTAPPPISEEKPRKKKGAARAHVHVDEPPPDDAMDPFDAAEEVVALMNGAFNALAQIRGYGMIMTEVDDGQGSKTVVPLLVVVAPTEESKARLKKAMARVLKSAGATMSPGAGLALAAFGTYGAPIIACEMGKAQQRKQAKAAA